MADLQVKENTMSSENYINVSKFQNLQGGINEIKPELNITGIKIKESEEQIHQLKSAISENSGIIDNKCPDNVEVKKNDLESELKRIC